MQIISHLKINRIARIQEEIMREVGALVVPSIWPHNSFPLTSSDHTMFTMPGQLYSLT